MDARFSTMHIFGASSFVAAVQSLPGGVYRRCRLLTALPGLRVNHFLAKFPHKTFQFQLHQLLRLHQPVNPPSSRLQVIVWHDVNKNS